MESFGGGGMERKPDGLSMDITPGAPFILLLTILEYNVSDHHVSLSSLLLLLCPRWCISSFRYQTGSERTCNTIVK